MYVAAPEGSTGKSLLAIGLIDALHREVKSVGVFRPIVAPGPPDAILEALVAQPGIDETYDEAVGVTYEDIHADAEAALATLVDKYAPIDKGHDAVVILGSDYIDVSTATELAFNADVAANLDAPVMVVVSGQRRTPEEIVAAIRSAMAEFANHHAEVIAVAADRVAPDELEAVENALKTIPGVVTAAIPADDILLAPTVGDQFEAIGATMILGNPELLSREAPRVTVAAMTLPNILTRLKPESTVILPGDRTDILTGIVLAHTSGAFPQLAAIILSGDFPLPDALERLLGTMRVDVPIGYTKLDTLPTAELLFRVEGTGTSSARKLEIARRLFAEHVDVAALLNVLHVHRSQVVTPLMFEHRLMELARSDRKTIVLPESDDDRILKSADILLRRGVADLILLGDPQAIQVQAARLGLALTGVKIIDPSEPELRDRFATEYAKLRAHKGMTFEKACEVMKDLSYFGTMMVHLGMADGMVSGANHTTANTILPSLEFIKTKPGVNVVSGSFLMCMADRVVVYADCAVNPNPSASQLADIAISSAQTATKFGIEPKVAMLSYSTGTSGSGVDVDEVRQATEMVRQLAPDLALDGPLQFDAAVDPVVARTKLPGSPVAGQATVFIFPDLNTGNNTYKAVQRSSGAVAIGPVLQGLNKPVNDLSRGALVDDIVNTVAITAIQAQTGA